MKRSTFARKKSLFYFHASHSHLVIFFLLHSNCNLRSEKSTSKRREKRTWRKIKMKCACKWKEVPSQEKNPSSTFMHLIIWKICRFMRRFAMKWSGKLAEMKLQMVNKWKYIFIWIVWLIFGPFCVSVKHWIELGR